MKSSAQKSPMTTKSSGFATEGVGSTKCLCNGGVMCKFEVCFLNFVQQCGTVKCFENPIRHKHKR
jgi:hypothetical protein